MINVAGIIICLSILFCAADVQAQSHILEQPQDTVPVIAPDSTLQKVTDSISNGQKNGNKPGVKQDTIQAKETQLFEVTSDKFFAPSYMFSPKPRKAVLFSTIFPGLGQIYNRKYWKLPILYGGFAGLTYAITWNNGYYRDYLNAYIHIMDDNPNTNDWHNMLPYGMDYETVDRQWFAGVLQQRKDYYRYYRDLSIIITVGLYVLGIVDAYVDAQLFDFDISPDLSMRMAPVLMRGEGIHNYGNSSFGMQWSLSF